MALHLLRDQLVRRRHALGLGTYTVAARMSSAYPSLKGCQRAALLRWESGSGHPNDQQLQAWASALGMELRLVEVAEAETSPELDPPTSPRARRAA